MPVTRTILIVDREVDSALELEARLTALGYGAVGIAESADDALALAARTAPDLVVIDIALRGDPGGAALGDAIRRRWQIPVVFTTAESEDATMQRTGIAEPGGHLAKPFTDRELHIAVELALCKHERRTQIHELEERFFAVSVDMLCYLGFNGYFKRLNPAWERTLGFTREELMSRPFIEFVHPDDRERTLAQNAAVRGGGQALGFENRYRCKDGSYRWFLWNATPGSAEQVIYSVARDITARKEAELERELLVQQLQTALAEVHLLQRILPICSYCKRVRDDENYWHSVESYVADHTGAQFSHSICPTCFASEVEPQLEAHERR